MVSDRLHALSGLLPGKKTTKRIAQVYGCVRCLTRPPGGTACSQMRTEQFLRQVDKPRNFIQYKYFVGSEIVFLDVR